MDGGIIFPIILLYGVISLEIKRNHPDADQETKRIRPVKITSRFFKANNIPEIGLSCRDCINSYFDVRLNRGDCKYEMGRDGHRRLDCCSYCGKVRPIVKGLTIIGRVKTLGKKL